MPRLVDWMSFLLHDKNPHAHHPVTKIVQYQVYEHDGDVSSGDGEGYFSIAAALCCMNLVTPEAHVFTASTSGALSIQLHNLTKGVDMLSTAITIDQTEKDSNTAATPPVVDTSNDNVNTGDEIRIDVDAAGTGAKGLELRLGFKKG